MNIPENEGRLSCCFALLGTVVAAGRIGEVDA